MGEALDERIRLVSISINHGRNGVKKIRQRGQCGVTALMVNK
ncbi:hypothetical protein [Bacillus sp. FJAT-27916]|nr:hypothetical protein [Bacillus sp. FJAT-27916]